MRKVFGKIGIALGAALALIALFDLAGASAVKYTEGEKEEFFRKADAQAAAILSSMKNGENLRSVRFQYQTREKDAGEFFNDSIPLIWERLCMYDELMDFPSKEPRDRRLLLEMYREFCGADSLWTPLQREKIGWMEKFRTRRFPAEDVKALSETFLSVKKQYNDAVSEPGMLLLYDVRYRKDRKRYDAYFITSYRAPDLRFVALEERKDGPF